MGKGISRRNLLKLGGAAAMAAILGCSSPAAGVCAMQGSKSSTSQEVTWFAGHRMLGTPSFLQKPDPIENIKETKEYDIVVIGAGSTTTATPSA